MNLALRKPITLAEFLEWEERQELRYEFDGVGPVAMTGGTWSHSTIQRNLAISVGRRLRGKPCQFQGSDLKFQVAAGHVRYPDGMVICSPIPGKATVVHDPVIVFEAPSSSTEEIDETVKLGEYQATPSVQRYVILQQDFVGAKVFARSGAAWKEDDLAADSILSLPEIGVSLALVELYEGIVFVTEPAADQTAGGGPA